MARLRALALNTQKKLDKLNRGYTVRFPNRSLTPEELEIKKKCENSLYEFLKQAWHTIEGGKFIEGWHIKLMCDVLQQAITKWEYTEVILNLPPRHAKTLTLVSLTAWAWLHDPTLKFFVISGDYRLSIKENLTCKMMIESEWYQRFWGDKVAFHKSMKSKKQFSNTRGGSRSAFSMMSNLKGHGANIQIWDDSNTDIDLKSDKIREAKNEFFSQASTTRFNDEHKRLTIVCQQRLHNRDVTGFLLESKNPRRCHLSLPVYYTPETAIKADKRTERGQVLWDEKWSVEYIQEQEAKLGKVHFSAQYLQNPIVADGLVFRKEWFRYWTLKSLPHFDAIICSVDTALTTNVESCRSVITTWGLFEDDETKRGLLMPLECWADKVEYSDLRKMILRVWENYHCTDLITPITTRKQPNCFLIEEAANGISLIQDLNRNTGVKIIGFKPKAHGVSSGGITDSSKMARARRASAFIEDGGVYIPTYMEGAVRTPYRHCNDIIEACVSFPRGNGADIVDTVSQVILYLEKSGDVQFKGYEPKPVPPNFDHFKKPYRSL